MEHNDDDLFHFSDDDDLFTDQVLDALDQQESIFVSTQQHPPPVHFPATTADVSLTNGNGLDRRTPLDQHDASERNRAEIDALRFTVERLQLLRAQDAREQEDRTRELEHARTQMKFMEQEMESLKREMRAKEKQKASMFPIEAFSVPVLRRAAASRTRSVTPGPRTAQNPHPPSPRLLQQQQRKRTLSDDKDVQPQPQPQPQQQQDLPPRLDKDAQNVDTSRYQFLRRILSQEFKESQLETYGAIKDADLKWPQHSITMLSKRFANRFIPGKDPQSNTGRKLSTLAGDISACISHPTNFSIEAVIQQLMSILSLCLKECISEKVQDVAAQTIYTIHHLVSYYPEAVQFMLREMERVGEAAMYWNVIRTTRDFLDIHATEKARRRHANVDVPPDLQKAGYNNIKMWCMMNRIEPSELVTMTKPINTQFTSEETLLQIIDIYCQVIDTSRDIPSSLFLLRQQALFDVLRTDLPSRVLLKSLDLLVRFSVEADAVAAFCIKRDVGGREMVSLIDRLMNIIQMGIPNESHQKEWYAVRTKAIILLNDTYKASPTAVRQEYVNPENLTILQQAVFQEAWWVDDMDLPPRPTIPLDLSENFIYAGLCLLNGVLSNYYSLDTNSHLFSALRATCAMVSKIIVKEWPSSTCINTETMRLFRILKAMTSTIPVGSEITSLNTA
ncbi:hypothetical protein BX666DRAFT_1982885 [Dichotomocladium elegans]|nr:hypothetical protein BX666DRAFT_1982885 [Dichotomocladium elegans]